MDEPRDGSASRQPDWRREYKRPFAWQPSRSLLASIRAYQRASVRRGPFHRLARRIAVFRHCFWSIVTGADIPLNSQLGGGLLLPHPNGIVIHPKATIGPNCLLFQQVTLGTRGGRGVPRLGCGVDVGAGARILGDVSIGDYAIIGANAVVLQDVAPGEIVAGIPAKPVGYRSKSFDPASVPQDEARDSGCEPV